MMSVSTEIDRGGEGSPIERASLRPHLVDSALSTGVLNIHKAKNVPLLVQNGEHVCKMHSFERGPPPRHSNGPGLPPPFLHTASNQKLDGGKAWEPG